VVLLLRFADRIGKGLRGPPRDALIADAVTADQRGRAFGLHQAMDHAGAVIGPLCAAGLLALGMELGGVFLAAAVPAALVMIVLVVAVDEPPRPPSAPVAVRPPGSSSTAPSVPLGRDVRRLVVAVVVFTLGNSTDAFLLLRLGQAGHGPQAVALLWSLHHVVKMAASYAGGRASDRWSRRPLLITAWLLYAAVYALFALLSSPTALLAIFLAYGVTLGLAEPVEKAWLTDLVPRERRGAAFGWLAGATGLAALPASLLFGALWRWYGAPVAFAVGALLAAVAALLLCRVRARE
jgi:MFS family permease